MWMDDLGLIHFPLVVVLVPRVLRFIDWRGLEFL